MVDLVDQPRSYFHHEISQDPVNPANSPPSEFHQEMMVDGPMVDGVVVEPESSKVAAAVVEDIMVVAAAVSTATPVLVEAVVLVLLHQVEQLTAFL